MATQTKSTRRNTTRRNTTAANPDIRQKKVTPSTIETPSFLMNFPFSYSTEIPNNAWMRDIDDARRVVNKKVAMKQFLALYQFISSRALVHLLPTPRKCHLQDLVFTANLGIILGHLEDSNEVIVSNFSSPPRMGETEVGCDFFRSMGYDVHVAPHKFEGEAELKHLHSNVYLGGYGERSRKSAYEWMESRYDMKIVKLAQTDPYLYHLDCSVFPLTREKTMVCTEMFTNQEIREIEKVTDIIEIPRTLCLPGITNSVRVSNCILNASCLHELQRGTAKHELELAKNRALLDICANEGLETVFFNLSEFEKGGALLSCMVMHLNRTSYDHSLI